MPLKKKTLEKIFVVQDYITSTRHQKCMNYYKRKEFGELYFTGESLCFPQETSKMIKNKTQAENKLVTCTSGKHLYPENEQIYQNSTVRFLSGPCLLPLEMC